jgi:hypothetical protein
MLHLKTSYWAAGVIAIGTRDKVEDLIMATNTWDNNPVTYWWGEEQNYHNTR